MLRYGLVLLVVAVAARGAFAHGGDREPVEAPVLHEDDVKQAAKAILTLYQADGVAEALPALRLCYDRLNSAAPFTRLGRCLGMDVALCLVLDVKAREHRAPVDDFCEAGRSGRRLAYWADEAIAEKADRPALLKTLFTYVRAGTAEYLRSITQSGGAMP